MKVNELNALEQVATEAAIDWAKSHMGYSCMEKAVNDYIEAIGANKAIGNDSETIRLSREAAALRININAIHALNKSEEQRLNDALMKIAGDGVPRKSRGWHR